MAKALEPKHARPQSRPGSLPRSLAEELRRTVPPSRLTEASARLRRAIDLLERGDSRGAAAEAARVRAEAPRSSSVREVLGIALYREGRFADALAELKAYKRMTGNPDQNHLIADSLRATGKPRHALALTDEELRSEVSKDAKVEAAIVGASALADDGRFAEAMAYLRKARTRSDVAEEHTLRLWYVTGDILERAGRKTEAAEEFQKIMRYDPSAYDAAERLAQLG
jgi:tetratricopeptide (TPR) repeat protein